jgi:hypothetical protein
MKNKNYISLNLGDFKIHGSALKVPNLVIKRLNNIPFNHIITLHTNQTFNHEIKVEGTVYVKGHLTLHEKVNGRNLTFERLNTVMVRDIKYKMKLMNVNENFFFTD